MNIPFIKTLSDFFLRKKQTTFFIVFGISLLATPMLQGCSDYGFHLRNSVELPAYYQAVSVENLPSNNDFKEIFEEALQDAGGSLVEDSAIAKSVIRFTGFKEGRRVVAYTSELEAREFLLSLKFNYDISIKNVASKKGKKLPTRGINIDRSYLYDPDFALGKAEEEKLVKKNLYQEAARLILLRLQYAK